MISMSSVEAQNNFGRLLDTALREPVAVTRYGRPVAYVVSGREIEQVLEARRQRIRAKEVLQKMKEKRRTRPEAEPES